MTETVFETVLQKPLCNVSTLRHNHSSLDPIQRSSLLRKHQKEIASWMMGRGKEIPPLPSGNQTFLGFFKSHHERVGSDDNSLHRYLEKLTCQRGQIPLFDHNCTIRLKSMSKHLTSWCRCKKSPFSSSYSDYLLLLW